MLVAAAREWGVPAAEITVERSGLSHARTGRRATLGELAVKAAAAPPPADVKLKDPKDFKLIGRRRPRLDSKSKTDGDLVICRARPSRASGGPRSEAAQEATAS